MPCSLPPSCALWLIARLKGRPDAPARVHPGDRRGIFPGRGDLAKLVETAQDWQFRAVRTGDAPVDRYLRTVRFPNGEKTLATECALRPQRNSYRERIKKQFPSARRVCHRILCAQENTNMLTDAHIQQIVGPGPREATFASSVVRRSCSVAPWPGQLRRSTTTWKNDKILC